VAPRPDRPPDAGAFVRIYDQQVEGVLRYLLAWTGDRAQAADLTGQVFRSAPRRANTRPAGPS
jgi:hypothetical protein